MPPAAALHAAAAARRAYPRPVAHTASLGHMPASSRRHDPISTSSPWLVSHDHGASRIIRAVFLGHAERQLVLAIGQDLPGLIGALALPVAADASRGLNA